LIVAADGPGSGRAAVRRHRRRRLPCIGWLPWHTQVRLLPARCGAICLDASEPAAMQAPGLRRGLAIGRNGRLPDRELRSATDGYVEQLIGPLFLLALVVIAALLVRTFVRVVTGPESERGLRYRSGRFTGLVDPGAHVVIRPLNEVRVIDGRPGFLLVQGQEVLTADGGAIKASLAARSGAGDPVAAVTNDQDFLRALHVELQLGLRDALS